MYRHVKALSIGSVIYVNKILTLKQNNFLSLYNTIQNMPHCFKDLPNYPTIYI